MSRNRAGLPTAGGILALLLLVAAVAVGGRALSAPPPDPILPEREPAWYAATPVTSPRPIAFPRDEAPHDNLTEWWYYTGHLRAGEDLYGFELVFFQSVRGTNPVGYAAHFALTDARRDSFQAHERIGSSPPLPRPQGLDLDLALGDWSLRAVDNQYHLSAREGDQGIDLVLASTKPPALHNGDGFISFGPAGGSYYYSRTRLTVAGTLDAQGTRRSVEGQAWMDHQWGDYIVGPGGWDWFSIQLDDQTELMLFSLRDPQNQPAGTYGSAIDAAGQVQDLPENQIHIEAIDTWHSPASGATYPSGWDISLPARGLQLRLVPTVRGQELNVFGPNGMAYWEGQVRVSGTRAGAPISGLGYVELTGYAPPPTPVRE